MKLKIALTCSLYIMTQPLWAEEPVLKMHIFKAPTAKVKSSNDLKMIIFDQNAKKRLIIPPSAQAVAKAKVAHRKLEAFKYWSGGISSGYQYERTAWQVSNPSIAETWQGIDIWKMRADLGFHLPIGFLLKGYAEYGFSLNGNIARTGEFNNISSNRLSSGYTTAFSGALGYEFVLGEKRQQVWGTLTPLIGYAYDEQMYKSNNNEYNTAWQGPWVGLEFGLGFARHHELFGSADVHWADFKALGAQQNYSLEHNATALGYKVSTGYRFQPNQRWAFSIILDYQHWQTGSGTETLTLPTQGFIESPLVSVKRDALGIRAAMDVAF